METLDNYTYIGNVKSRLLKNGEPVTEWCKNSVCKSLADLFVYNKMAKRDELDIEIWRS